MKTYYKATRPDGTDFYSGTVDYAGALNSGQPLENKPDSDVYRCCSATVYHASDTPSETLTGGSWPCRLFEVTGQPVAQEGHKFGFRSLRVVREVEAWKALGPNGEAVVALLKELGAYTRAQWVTARDAARDAAMDAARDVAMDAARAVAWTAAMDAAKDAARDAAWAVAWTAARDAAMDAAMARDAAMDAARDAAWGAAWGAAALTVKDLIEERHFDILFAPIVAARAAAA